MGVIPIKQLIPMKTLTQKLTFSFLLAGIIAWIAPATVRAVEKTSNPWKLLTPWSPPIRRV